MTDEELDLLDEAPEDKPYLARRGMMPAAIKEIKSILKTPI